MDFLNKYEFKPSFHSHFQILGIDKTKDLNYNN